MSHAAGRPHVALGHCVGGIEAHRAPSISYDEAVFAPHVTRPWFRAFLSKRYGIEIAAPATARGEVSVTDAALARHAFVCGATGSGKTRLLVHLVREQLRQGCSAVVLDQKMDTLDAAAACAIELGLDPRQVTVISPRHPDRVPGWNPLLSDETPLHQRVADLVSLLQDQHAGATGPRMWDLLVNALTVLGAHGLSLLELPALLRRSEYREALLARHPASESALAYREAQDYFLHEFGAWGKAERAQAYSPVLNKVRELITSPFLAPLLCARSNTLSLPALWERQCLVLVHLDRAALGESGARLLAGLTASALFRVAMRARGETPVVFCLDELATVERYVGEALCQTLTLARGYNLRVLAACQHLEQLSDALRAALLGNAGLRVFFRLGHADARLVAASLTAGGSVQTARLHASLEYTNRRVGAFRWASSRHAVLDGYGRPLRVRRDVWEQWSSTAGLLGDRLSALLSLAARCGITRCYVRAADTGEPIELRRYVAGLRRTDFRITGPAPVELVIAFPQPRISGVERTSDTDAARAVTRLLQDLPVRHAVCTGLGLEPAAVQITHVDAPGRSGPVKRFLQAAVLANGQDTSDFVERAQDSLAPTAGPVSDERDQRRGQPLSPARAVAPTDSAPSPRARPRRHEAPIERDTARIGANLLYISYEGEDDGSLA